MDCDYPVPDIYDDNYCVANNSLNDPDDQDEDYCGRIGGNLFPQNGDREECKPMGKQHLKATLPFPNDRKETAILRKLEKGEEINSDMVEDCCIHNIGAGNETANPRTFLLTFDATDEDEACKLEEKNRCLDFWKYVDSNELLQTLVREGEFVYERAPQQVHQSIPIGNLAKRKPRKTEEEENFDYMLERDRTVHEDEAKRLYKQRQRNLELQFKSGQMKKLVKKKPDVKEAIYSDLCAPTVSEVMREMKIFDSLTKNPVKVPENFYGGTSLN